LRLGAGGREIQRLVCVCGGAEPLFVVLVPTGVADVTLVRGQNGRSRHRNVQQLPHDPMVVLVGSRVGGELGRRVVRVGGPVEHTVVLLAAGPEHVLEFVHD